jgi:hypothetical protein
MDSVFLTKVYEEKGYDEFVKCIELAKEVDRDKLSTFSQEELLQKINFLEKSNELYQREIENMKNPMIKEKTILERPLSSPSGDMTVENKSLKSKQYSQALLTILKKNSTNSVDAPSSPKIMMDMKKNIIYQVLQMDKEYENMDARVKQLKSGSNEYLRMSREMNKLEKDMSVLISRMATLARRGHEASKIPEESSMTVGTFLDGTQVKLHRFTRNLFTEDVMDENGDIMNIDFIKFYQTYEKKLGTHDVIWYSLSEKVKIHFQRSLEDPTLRKFMDLATCDLLDKIVPIKSNKK